MKKIFQSALLLSFVALTLASCKNNVPKEAKYIPKEAGFVMVLDPQQMQDKLQKGGISMDTLVARIFKNDSPNSTEKAEYNSMKDSAGIDWGNKLFVFMQQKTNPDKSTSTAFSVIGGLSDAAKFEAWLKKDQHHKNQEIKKEKEYSYMSAHEGGVTLAWNDQQVIATMYTHVQKPVYDTVAMTFKAPNPANNDAEVKQIVANYFTQKVSESLANVSMFTDMFKAKADGYLFTSSNSTLSALSAMPLSVPKLEEFMKDNYTTATLNFEDGKIVAKSTTYPNEMVKNVLKEYTGPTVDLSLLEHYPSQHINAVMLASFNPAVLGGVLKQLEVEGLVNSFLEKAGLGSQDLYKSLKGDMALIVSDLGLPKETPDPQNKHDEKSMLHTSSFGKMIFNAPVGDKVSFMKLMDKAVESGFLVKKNNTYQAAGLLSTLGLFVKADEKNLIIASDSLTYINYMAKTGNGVMNKEVLDRFKGKSSAFYFDMAGTIGGFMKDTTDGGFSHSLNSARLTFKDMIGTADNFNGKSINGVFEMRMQNEKQNSLVTLTSLVTDIAVDMRLKAKKEKESEEKMFPGGVPAIIRTN
jgi:hypothetical protein